MTRLLVSAACSCLLGFGAMQTGAQVSASDSFSSYQAHLAAAEKSLRLNQSRDLRRWLDGAPEAHRGWEWHYLNAVSDTSQSAVAAPDGPVRIAMSPDGSMVATVEGSRVKLRGWPSLETVRTIDGHADVIYRAEFSPDGRRLVTVARDVTSRTWDVTTGEEIARIELANPAFAAANFSPDGSTAVTCAWERVDGEVHGLVWVWDATTGEVRARQRVGIKPLSAIHYTPNGKNIVVGSWDGLVHVLDPEANEVQRLVLPDEDIYNAVNDIAISPDGRLVAAGTKDRTVRVFDLASGELVTSLRGHGGFIEGLAFSPDGTVLASASEDTTVGLWNTADWTSGGVMRGHLATVRGVVWSPDGAALTTVGLDDTLRIWNAGSRFAPQRDIETGQDGIYSAAINPADGRIAVACYDGWMRVFNTEGDLAASWEAHPGSTCHAAAYSHEGSRLITCSWDNTARVWSMPSGQSIAVLNAEVGVYSATISPDGARAALAATDLQIWDVDGLTMTHHLTIEGATAIRTAFSSDGARLASGWSDGAARVYDIESGDLLATLEGHGGRVETVDFTPDDRCVATGDANGTVRLFASNGGPALFACDTGDRAIHQLAVSGDRIAVGSDRLCIIDATHGGIVMERVPHIDSVWHLSWSPDGSRLATCSINGTIAVLERPD